MNLKSFCYIIMPKYRIIETKYCDLREVKKLVKKNDIQPSILKWYIDSYDIENGYMIIKMIRKQRIYE